MTTIILIPMFVRNRRDWGQNPVEGQGPGTGGREPGPGAWSLDLGPGALTLQPGAGTLDLELGPGAWSGDLERALEI